MAVAKYSKTRSKRQLESLDYVPLEPFREVFQREAKWGLTVGEVGRRMGVDRERAAVLLGAKGGGSTKSKALATGEVKTYDTRPQQRVTYDVGVRLCRALGATPIEVGV